MQAISAQIVYIAVRQQEQRSKLCDYLVSQKSQIGMAVSTQIDYWNRILEWPNLWLKISYLTRHTFMRTLILSRNFALTGLDANRIFIQQSQSLVHKLRSKSFQ